MTIVAPSILSANFLTLGEDIEMIQNSEAEWIHIDVMDGSFVPNISFGFPILRAVRRATNKFLDVHLMIVEPERYIERFVAGGADSVTFHLEAAAEPMKCIELIRQCGAKVGISIKPATDVEALRELIPHLDMVLIMSVEPGFGGQSFIPESLQRIAELRAIAEELSTNLLIEVDGGITLDNYAEVVAAGADVLVAGSAIFNAENPIQAISKIINS